MFLPEREYYIKNDGIHKSSEFDLNAIQNYPVVYEVIRLIAGHPIFLDEHLERLRNSLSISAFNYPVKETQIKKLILKLIGHNKQGDGNIFFCVVNKKGSCDLFIYFIAHHYPSDEDYTKGVEVESMKAMRDHPDVKRWNEGLRQKAAALKKESEAYEILLVDDQGYITEGSRSNIFLIKAGKLYTPPAEKVLNGITRQKVIGLCKEMNIELLESDISLPDMPSFDAAFISGTSPRILPVRRIDKYTFDVNNLLMRSLMGLYDDLLASG